MLLEAQTNMEAPSEPALPPLYQPACEESRAGPERPCGLSRKRTRSFYDDEPATSSDPATFSSDETAPGAENYAAGKRKKHRFRGTWWESHPATNRRMNASKKREFRRNFDSGIFMGSETEEPLSSDSFSMEDELLKDQQKATEKHRETEVLGLRSVTISGLAPRPKLVPKSAVEMPKEHQTVCDIVQQCLELGKEDVNLS
jgi:hypothetical protein